MKRLLFTVCMTASAFAAAAAEPSDASIETLLTLTQPAAVLETIYGSMEQNMRQGMAQAAAGRELTAEQRRILDEAPRRFAAILREEVTWARLKPVYVRIYKDTFTQEDIDGLNAFYQSPAGHALVVKMPLALQRSMAAVQDLMAPVVVRMRDAMQQAIEEARIAR